MTEEAPGYDALEDIGSIAKEISSVLQENKEITANFVNGEWIVLLSSDGLAEIIMALSGIPLSQAFLDAAQAHTETLYQATYLEVDGEPFLQMPELSLLNFGVWVKRNSKKF